MYHAITYSSYFKGQSLGKVVRKIQVTNRNENYLSKPMAFIRALLLIFPFYIDDYFYLNIEKYNYISSFCSIVISINTILFLSNTPTRETIHDFATRSFVLDFHRLKTIKLKSNISRIAIYLIVGLSIASCLIYYFTKDINNEETYNYGLVQDEVKKIDGVDDCTVYKEENNSYTIVLDVSSRSIKEHINASDSSNVTLMKIALRKFVDNDFLGKNHSRQINAILTKKINIGIISETNSINYTSEIGLVKKGKF